MVLSAEKMEQTGSNLYCPSIYGYFKSKVQKPLELIDFLKKIKAQKINEVDANEIKHFQYFFILEVEEIELINEILRIKDSVYITESTDVEKSVLVNDSMFVYNSARVRSSHDVKNSTEVEGSSTIVHSTNIVDSKFVFNSDYIKSSINIRDSKCIESTSCANGSNIVFNSDNIDDSFGIEFSSYLKNCYFCKTCYKLENGILCYSFVPFTEGKYYFCNKEITKERFEGYADTVKMIMSETFKGNSDKKTKARELKNLYEWALGLPEADEDFINAILKKGRYCGNDNL